jgi:hypothetical protein
MGNWERENRLKVGSLHAISREVSLFAVEGMWFRDQLSNATCDGDVDKGIAFL